MDGGFVSKNGNLLLDVGPEADGTVPPVQLSRLQALGAWLQENGGAIYGRHPWSRAMGQMAEGIPVRFTQNRDRSVWNATGFAQDGQRHREVALAADWLGDLPARKTTSHFHGLHRGKIFESSCQRTSGAIRLRAANNRASQ